MHVCISMPSVSAAIACIGPLGHGNHHSIPKTPPRDPAPGGTHSGHPRACARPLFDPIPTPPSDPIFRFFLSRIGVGTCLATAIESARMLWTRQNFAESPSRQHSTGPACVCWNQIFIFAWRVHQRRPPPTLLWLFDDLGAVGMCMYVHVCIGICIYQHVSARICMYCVYA